MAWENLPTDYTDATWNGYRKYNQVNNDDGTVSFLDVTQYTNREKSFFGASDANKVNGAINDLIKHTTKITTGTAYVSSFESDDTYADYPYRGTITLADESIEITKDTYTELRVAEGQSQDTGILRDIVNTFDGGIYVWASEVPTFDILFSNIKVF